MSHIGHSGFIFPEPRPETDAGTTYQYSLDVNLVNNLSGGGKVTVDDKPYGNQVTTRGYFPGQ